MMTIPQADPDEPIAELLGTFLQVSAQTAPGGLPLRQAAAQFREWANHQTVARLDSAYDHLVRGIQDPPWHELGVTLQ